MSRNMSTVSKLTTLGLGVGWGGWGETRTTPNACCLQVRRVQSVIKSVSLSSVQNYACAEHEVKC